VALKRGRTDQGIDFSGAGPIPALADGVVTLVRRNVAGWLGGSFLVYRYLTGPYAGRYEFVAEDFNPSVQVGQHVSAGQTLGTATGGQHGIERGWASGATSLTAAAHGHYTEGQVTAEGKQFGSWFDRVTSGDQLGSSAGAAVQTGKQFADAVLRGIGAPLTAANELLIASWAAAEGTKARYNPLATTQPYAGATNFNSAGVKNYPSFAAGVAATVQTLKNGRYPFIVQSLQSNNAVAITQTREGRAEISVWGTSWGNLTSIFLGRGAGEAARSNWLADAVGGVTGAIGDAAGAVASPFAAVGDVIGKLLSPDFWLRVLEMLAGGVLVLLGLYLLAKEIGLEGIGGGAKPVPIPIPV
jgi:hypothetical protein